MGGLRFIFAQIHRSSSRWQLPAIAALSQYPYHLSGSLPLVGVRIYGIHPCRPLPLTVQRHSDEGAPLPTENDAQKCVEFALAFAEFLFVLPSRIERGLKDSQKQ